MSGGPKACRLFVGIPTYNRPDMVRETIESLRKSELTDFVAIVSDNVSAPDAAQAVDDFVTALGDDRFRFVRQPSNAGEYGQGRYFFSEAEMAKAEYFMILHDDDLLDPDYLTHALKALDAAPDAALYIANPRLIDEAGTVSAEMTDTYLRDHGRSEQAGGYFPILETLLGTGFTPISGTVFRRSALVKSGFVDDDCFGNFPFEMNVLLRLGDIGLKGWFTPETKLSVRYHKGSLRNTLGLMQNPAVVGTMLTLLERRTYTGFAEKRRRKVLSRLYRARAEIALAKGERASAKNDLRLACRARVQSINAWKARLLMSLMRS